MAVIAGVDPLALLLVVGFLLPAHGLGALLAGSALDFGVTERRAIIVGGGERALRVMAELAAAGADIRVCGIFDDRDDDRSPPVMRGVPKLGTLSSLIAFVRAAEIDLLVVTLPLSADRRIREILKAFEVLPVDVRLSDFSDDPAFARRRLSVERGGGGLIDVMSRPLRQRQRVVKRVLDIVGAATAVLLLSPLLLATALAIRLETRGPILFRQPRHGYNHRPVVVWKFRSMYAEDCDPAARRIELGRVAEAAALGVDPRITNSEGATVARSDSDFHVRQLGGLRRRLPHVAPPHRLCRRRRRRR